MRKIWWLPVICIAACVAQALVAADSQSSATRKSPASGRSRLLIYSRHKTPDGEPEVEPEQEAAPVTRKPRGDTGTISPKSSATKTAAKASSVLPADTAGKIQPVNFESSEKSEASVDDVSDEEIRQMFEEETAGASRRSTPRSETVRPQKGRAELSDVEPLDPQVRRASRYKELLGPNSAGSDRSQTKAKTITPVSSEERGKPEFEVNPFEPSERPTKVVNASWEEEKGETGSRRVKQASATVATKSAVTDKLDKPTTAKTAAKAQPVYAKTSDSLKTKESPKAAELTKPMARAATAPKEMVDAPATRSYSSGVAETGTHSPQVEVKWEVRGEVTLGQECQCALLVHNSGKVTAREIVVEANFPESVQLVDAKPFPKEASQRLEWQFVSMAAGEKKIIELTMVPTKRGELAASAQVRFTGTAATSFQVSEPMLTASVKLPEEVHLGEPASATVTVSNPGTGTAQNVIVEAILPKGLSSTSGKDAILELGPLGAGETRTVRMSLLATGGGDQALKIVARSSTADLEQTASARVNVLAPSLALKATGPSLRYVNRAAKYQLTATNNSNAASDNVRIIQTVDRGFDFVKADHAAQWDTQRRVVSWYLGHLDAGQSVTVELELMPKETGEFQQQFRVVGDSGVQATAEVATRVEGAASLVMELKDSDDPVEVGTETTFEIRVRNDGSKSAHKVAISLELPPDIEMTNVDGPTPHLFESGMLIFKPLSELAAGDSATFLVHIKGTASGTTKLRARLTSESIQKPLIVEEAAQFYQE